MGRGLDRVRGKDQDEGVPVNNNRVPSNPGTLDRESYSLPTDRYGQYQKKRFSRDLIRLLLFFAEKATLPSISSDRSAEDISNLQLKGSSSTSANVTAQGHGASQQQQQRLVASDVNEASQQQNTSKPAAAVPTKPILKTRKPDSGLGYQGDNSRYTMSQVLEEEVISTSKYNLCCSRGICRESTETGTPIPWTIPTFPLVAIHRW